MMCLNPEFVGTEFIIFRPGPWATSYNIRYLAEVGQLEGLFIIIVHVQYM